MVLSTATTVAEYLESLPSDRREQLSVVRDVILSHLPKGYEETMNWGMISYEIPLSIYSKTYNKKPLMIAAIAAQKNFNSVYLMGVYGHELTKEWFEREWKKTGKRLDAGKSCFHFKSADDLALDLIGQLIAKVSVKDYLKHYEASLDNRKTRKTT